MNSRPSLFPEYLKFNRLMYLRAEQISADLQTLITGYQAKAEEVFYPPSEAAIPEEMEAKAEQMLAHQQAHLQAAKERLMEGMAHLKAASLIHLKGDPLFVDAGNVEFTKVEKLEK